MVTKIHTIKLSAELAKYLIFSDLASKFIITEEEVDAAIKVLRRNLGQYTLKNGDKVMYISRSWILKRY